MGFGGLKKSHRQGITILAILLLILISTPLVKPLNATTNDSLKLQITTLNNSQDIDFKLKESNYTIYRLLREPINLNEPISWKLLLTDGIRNYDITYETQSILKTEQETIKEKKWNKKIILKTDYEQPYANINLTTKIPSTKTITINPNYTFEKVADDELKINIPELNKKQEIELKGTLNETRMKWELQTTEGPIRISKSNGELNDFLEENNQLMIGLKNLKPQIKTELIISFPYDITNATSFYTFNELKSEKIILPYNLLNSTTIKLNPDIAINSYSQLSNQQIIIYGEIIQKEKQEINFSINTKTSYYLGEQLNLQISPTNATSFTYLTRPDNNTVLIKNNETYLLNQTGNYELETSIYYADQTKTLKKTIVVVERNISSKKILLDDKEIELITEEAIIKTVENNDGELFIILENLSNENPELKIKFTEQKIPETFFYIWLKTINGHYKQIPYQVSGNRTMLDLHLEDGKIDYDEELNGKIIIKTSLYLPKQTKKIKRFNKQEIQIEKLEPQNNLIPGRTSISSKTISLPEVNLKTTNGDIQTIQTVNEKNLPFKPTKRNFKNDLLKFTITNISKGETVSVKIRLDEQLKNPTIWKFNPYKTEWYKYNYKQLDEHTLEIRLTDGGLGDDDGLVNGVIEDDLGITTNWWNDSWSYRQEINITNNDLNENITDYQVEISLTNSIVAEHFIWSDNSSIRFTQYNKTSDSETKLNYYILSWNQTAKTAKILVKTKFIPAFTYDDGFGAGKSLLFMYYNNSNAISESNASATYIWYDDFSTDTTSQYKEVDADTQAGTGFSIIDGYYNMTGRGADTWGSNDQYAAASIEVTGDFEAEVKILSQTNTNNWAKTGLMIKNNVSKAGNSTGYVFMTITPGNGYAWQRDEDGNGYLSSNTNTGGTSSYPGYVKIIKSGDSFSGYYSLDNATTWTLSSSRTINTANNTQDVAIALTSHNNGAVCEVHFDDFKIKKYVSASITTSLGNENYAGLLNVTINLPNDKTNLTRNSLFTMNGTVSCELGNCQDTSTYYQYYATVTPLQTKIFTTSQDFEDNEEAENISIGNDLFQLKTVSSDIFWWNTSWSYRQSFNISSSEDLTNYTIRLNLTSSDVGSNFDWSNNNSLRFVQIINSETQELGYFIESWNETNQETLINIKIPYLNSSKETTIWMYYGNDQAQSKSNYSRAFLLADDFSSGSINSFWSETDKDSTSGTGFGINNSNLEINASGSDTWISVDQYASLYSAISGNFIATAEITYQENTNNWAKAGLMIKNDMTEAGSSAGYVFMVITPGNNFAWQRDEDGDGYLSVNTAAGTTVYPAFVRVIKSGTSFSGYYSEDGTTWNLISTRTISSAETIQDVGLSVTSHSSGTESTVDFNNILVKRYSSSIPTYTSGSEEEIQFLASGNYQSTAFDTGSTEVSFKNITWDVSSNENTSISVYTRTSDGAEGLWWDNDWTHRMKINITSEQDVVGLPVEISLNTSKLYQEGKLQSDCDDLRFIKFNSQTLEYTKYNYWIETCNVSGGNSTIWVNVTSLEANTPETIQIYYNNTLATSESDVSKIFLFYDNFEGTSLNTTTWSATASNNVSVSGGVMKENAGSIYTNNIIGRSDNLIVESKLYWTENTGDSYAGMMTVDVQDMHGSNSDSDANVLYMTSSGGSSTVRYYAGDGTDTGYNLGNGALFTRTSGQYYILGTAFNGTNIVLYRDGVVEQTLGTFNETIYAYLGAFIGSDSGTTDIQDITVDWIRARKFISNIPTQKLMSEESYDGLISNSNAYIWSDWYLESSGSALQAPSARYLEYKVKLSSNNNKQTPQLKELRLDYKITTADWTDMDSSNTLFTANSPFSNGILNKTNKQSKPTLEVLPKKAGEYKLRLKAKSISDDVEVQYSNSRNVTVWIQPELSSFDSSKEIIARNETTTLSVLMLDDASLPMKNYNLSFYDKTGNGSILFIGSSLTDDSGRATIDYKIPGDSILGTHTLNVSYNGSVSLYIRPVSLTTTIKVSSKPEITNIQKNPSNTGFNLSINISANITDTVGLDHVKIKITDSSSNTDYYEMTQTGNQYYYIFSDTWSLDDYEFQIIANNTDGVTTTSSKQSFSIKTSAYFNFTTTKTNYKNNEQVNLSILTKQTIFSNWSYRTKLTFTPSFSENNFQVKIDLNNMNFNNFDLVKEDGSDLRLTWINSSGDENEIPLFIEKWDLNNEEGIIWTKLNLTKDQNETIYLYYGNNEVSTISNGSKVFDFFDGFSGSVLDSSVWTATSSSNVVVGGGRLLVKAGSVYSNSVLGWSNGSVVESKLFWLAGSGSGYSGLMTVDVQDMQGGNSDSDANVLYMTSSGGSSSVHLWAGDGTDNSYNLANENVFTRDNATDYVIGIAFNESNIMIYKDYVNQATIGTFNKQIYSYLGYFTGSGAGSTDIQDINVTWIRKRKYHPNEPEPTVVQNEILRKGLVNNGTTDFRAYLMMNIQKWTGSTWSNIIPPVIDHQLKRINSSHSLDVASLWLSAGAWNTADRKPGTYRVRALLEDPSRNTLTDSEGNLLFFTYNFTIIEPVLSITNLTYENKNYYALEEYEVGDIIDWINITVRPENNTAYDANVTLSILDKNKNYVGWGPLNETKSCGDLNEGEECENEWNNGTNGYEIPSTASEGDYKFYWNVLMKSSNGQDKINNSLNFKIHNIPSTITSTLSKTRIYKPNETVYNFTFSNQWSKNITNTTVTINCPPINGFDCNVLSESGKTKSIGEVSNGSTITISFNVSINTSVPSDNYIINATLNYTNPAGENRTWNEKGAVTIEARLKGILSITDNYHPENITRLHQYNISAFDNNSADDSATNTWLNFSLPSNWDVIGGSANKSTGTINAHEIAWNNLTVKPKINAGLGTQEIRIDSGADDGRNDFKIYYINVFADTNLTAQSETTIVNREENSTLLAKLTYDNGTIIQNANISFKDETTGEFIGSALTNSTGWAKLIYELNSTIVLGYHTINMTYEGDNSLYVLKSEDSIIIDVHEKPKIENVLVNPENIGFGNKVLISAEISDADDISSATIKITKPNGEIIESDFPLTTPPKKYSLNFNNTWIQGVYNITIIANDTTGAVRELNNNSFLLNVSLTTSLQTKNQTYSQNEIVNLTKPRQTWWNNNWIYRKNMTLTGITESMDNYQQKIKLETGTLYAEGKLNSDCGDLRIVEFNSSDNSFTELPIYFEDENCSIESGGETIIWTKIPHLSSTVNLQIYYGNKDASLETTEPDQIFDFFDGFSGSVLDSSVWTATSSSNVVVGGGRLLVKAGSVYSNSVLGWSNGSVVESKLFWLAGSGSGYSGLMTVDVQDMQGGNSDSDANVLYMTSSGGSSSVRLWAGDGTDNSYNLANNQNIFTRDNATDYILGIAFNESNIILYKDYEPQATIGTFNKQIYSYLGYFTGSGAGSTDIQDINVTWIRKRKKLQQDPTETLSSEEQTGSFIKNNYMTNSSAYLLMQVQFNNSGNWITKATIINDSETLTSRSINQSNLDLSTIWNNEGGWNTGTNEYGSYRVHFELVGLNGTILKNEDGTNIEKNWNFEIEQPELLLNISEIRVYELTDAAKANWHIYTNELIDSGTNKTFVLNKNNIYRIEFDIQNVGSTTWTINETNITYNNYNSSWPVNQTADIWYSTELQLSDRRSDSTKEGGLFDQGIFHWNESDHDGILSSSSTATFFLILNITNTEDRQIILNVSHSTFEKDDYSLLHIIELDNEPPKLYQDTYNITNRSILRGNSTMIYARWSETIAEANETHTTTSELVYVTNTNSSPQNSENWTNFTISSASAWNLGIHKAKIIAEDENGNVNDTLEELNFTVNGLAQITSMNLNTSTINQGDTVLISCKVTDHTDSDNPISNYLVKFYNSTNLLGTNSTNSSGWSTYEYQDNTLDAENISCKIEANQTKYYWTDDKNESTLELMTKELQAPQYHEITGPSVAHRGDYINLDVRWTDNYLLSNASLEINLSGTLTNESTQTISGTDDWANFTYQIPLSTSLGNITWKQYGVDYFNNQNKTPSQSIEVWAYSKIISSSIDPASMQEGNTTKMSCKVIDANTTTELNNYIVSFFYKNSTETSYTLLGKNQTNSSGWADYSFIINDADTYDIKCNITDNASQLYNKSSENYAIESLNVVAGSDTQAPRIIGSNYTINTTELYLGDCFEISGLWDESINESYIKYNKTSSEITRINISSPYTANWTNLSVCTNESWDVGNYSIRLYAKDQAGNLNNTLEYKQLLVKNRVNLYWNKPVGNLNRTINKVSCKVLENYTGNPVENYEVTFYDGDLGFSIGTNTTNSSGIAEITYDFSSLNVGPDELTCTISANENYDVAGSSSQSETVYFYGQLNATIDSPTTNKTLHRSMSEDLNASVIDEFGNTPKDENGNTASLTAEWYDETTTNIASGTKTVWTPSSTYTLGPQELLFNVTQNYYYPDQEKVNVTIFGYANVSLQKPTAGIYGDNVLLNITCLVSDVTATAPINNYEVNISQDGIIKQTGNTNSSGQTTYQVNTNTLSEGDYEFMCEIGDEPSIYYSKTNPYMSTVSINIDKRAPNISYNPNTDSSGNYSKDWILINVSASDQNLENVSLWWNGTEEEIINNEGNNYWINKTNLLEGEYVFYAMANDSTGAQNKTSNRTIVIDLTAPIITIYNPENNSVINQTSTDLNYSVYDLTLDYCKYSLNGGPSTLLPDCKNSSVGGLAEGENDLIFFAYDKVGHESNVTINLTVDTINPSLTVQSPINGTTYETKSVDLNFTASDEKTLDTCWYRLDQGTKQILSNCENTTLIGLTNDWHNITISVNDTAGNINQTTIQFKVNYSELVATAVYPTNNSVITNTTVDLNASTNKEATECNYTLDSTITNSLTSTDNLSWTISVNSLAQGNHNVSFTCTDNKNTSTTELIIFKIDSLGPEINFVNPTPNNNTAAESDYVYVNITLNEAGKDVILEWHNDSGTYNFTMNNNSNTNYWYNLTNLSDDTYTYKVFAKDLYENQNQSDLRTVIIATGAPAVFITHPIENKEYNITVQNLDVSASKSISKWVFTLNDENFTFEPNITLASKFGNNTLTVWATDLYGNTGSSQVNYSVNASQWLDTFGSYTGLETSTNLKTGSNASTLFCWPALSSATTPQDNPATCWPYRRTINLSSSSTLTDYQVRLNLDLSTEYANNKLQSSCEDLRFTYSNTTSASQVGLVNYWIENCSDKSKISVWVNIPRITSSTQLQIYFGNKLADSESNGTKVFDFFDEMNEASSDRWGSNINNWESSNSKLSPTDSGSTAKITSSYTTPNSYATELWIKGNSSSGASGYYGIGTGSYYLNLYLEPSDNRINFYNGANNYYTVDVQKEQKYTLITDFDNNNFTIYINDSTSPAISLTSAASGGQTNPVFYPYYVNGLTIDRIAIRKYSANYPTQSAMGSEETPITNTTLKSELLKPGFGNWDVFTAKTNVPTGTSIIFRILDETNNSLCGDLTTTQLNNGYEACSAVENKSIYLYAKLTTDATQKSATIYNWSFNWTSDIKKPDLLMNSINFMNTSQITEGEIINITINISNNGTADANNFNLTINRSLYNGTKNLENITLITNLNLSIGSSKIITINWTTNTGKYIFDAYIDQENRVEETNETNNEASNNITISSWQIIYGNYSYNLTLQSSIDKSYYDWSTINKRGTLYYADTDSTYNPTDLKGLNGTNDLQEADEALNMSGYPDSIKALYDKDNDGIPDTQITAIIGGETVSGIPVINTTNTSTFVTGILYDSADGLSYTGSQDLIFITFLNASKQGAYGVYDFEVRLPSNLDTYKGSSNSIVQSLEVN